ncbi:hypothetical protein KPL78_19965 [Roseomonas sp. HJA6]|uniref:Alpha/beta hydrolase n=1 Tax=Roseomonas alba TaxID=2846776 RepID=A0ABS7ACW8_9PROT|nr:hypothetical protein [Neoroseomonas alba]MBW6400146.1 hypothetical protein [Neoroseomonas alba]
MSHTTAKPSLTVRRRLVLHVPGYEPLSGEAQRRRLARTLDRSAAAWGLVASTGPGEVSAGGTVHAFQARLSGPDWATQAEVRILAWDDLIAGDLAKPMPVLIPKGLGALAGLLMDGTLARYRAAHWRYLIFVALPLLALAGAILGGVLAGLLLGGWRGLALGVVTFTALAVAADRWLHLRHLMADWVFARDLARGARPDITDRITCFADEIIAARRRDVDEVVLTGHSLGMVLAVEALAEALDRDPDPPRTAPPLALVGLGSSLLKIALMPEAGRLRASVGRIAALPGLAWLEFTSRRDLVCFHGADPVAVLGLPGQGPRLERIHPRAMLDHAAWCRVRRSMLRAHRVYVTGCGRRYFYDWGLIACGPGAVGRDPFPDRMIGPDGGLAAPPLERAA